MDIDNQDTHQEMKSTIKTPTAKDVEDAGQLASDKNQERRKSGSKDEILRFDVKSGKIEFQCKK